LCGLPVFNIALIASLPTLYTLDVRRQGSEIEKETDVETELTMMKEEREAIVENTVIALENDTRIGTANANGKGAVKEKARGLIAAVEDTAVTANEIETAKTVTETEGVSVTTMRNWSPKTALRGRNLTRMLMTLGTALAQPTETVLPTEGQEVGLLSIHETNSMIHPDIEGITVVGGAGALLGMMTMNTRSVVPEREALRPLLLGT